MLRGAGRADARPPRSRVTCASWTRRGALLRQVFRTQNALTLAVSGTGSAGMEALRRQPGRARRRGDRLRQRRRSARAWSTWPSAAARRRATVEAPVGPDRRRRTQVAAALAPHPRAKLVGHRPRRDVDRRAPAARGDRAARARGGRAAGRRRGDVARRAMQLRGRRLGHRRLLQRHAEVPVVPARPGAGHVQRRRALEAMDRRKTKVQSWYLDMSLIRKYWGADRVYHHTAPINMTYALHEALRVRARGGAGGAHRAPPRQPPRACAPGSKRLGFDYVRRRRSLPPLNAVHDPGGRRRRARARRGCSTSSASRSAAGSARSRARPGASA